MRTLADALHPARRWTLLLALAEFLALFLAFQFAVFVRFFGDVALIEAAFGDSLARGLLFACVLMLAMTSMGLYAGQSRDGWSGHAVRVLVAFVGGGLVLLAVLYATPVKDVGRGVMAIALASGFVAVLALRALALAVGRGELLRRQVLVLGTGEKADLIHSRLRRASDRRTFGIVGYVPMPGDAPRVPVELHLDASQGLVALVDLLAVDEIVVAPDCRRGTLPLDALMACRLRGVLVNELHDFLEMQTGRAQINVLSPSWVVFESGFDRGVVRSASKRAFDILSASALFVLALPVMLLTALCIKLESGPRGPVFYLQERVGEGGRTFRVIKFRSMRTDAERDGVARWATSDDDRVTRVGRVIRKLRIDELPQVVNVLKGEMSFVGPRPERPAFVEQLEREIPYYGLRHVVKPGITGWAQLRYAYGASVKDAEEKLKYDLYYVKHQSLMFDLLVLLQTVEVVLFGKGAR
ncbi:MAG: sugar transferase [Silanimonas sp.]|nr:MAG: sugar transferase [Silanimonas sp.]